MGYRILAENITFNEFKSLVESYQKAGFKANLGSMYIKNGDPTSLITFLGDIDKGNARAILADEENHLSGEAEEIFHKTLNLSRKLI